MKVPIKNNRQATEILGIYHFTEEYVLDEYTVIVNEPQGNNMYAMLGLSKNGTGFSQWGQGHYFPAGDNSHLGKEVEFRQLNKQLQKHILDRLEE